MKIVPGFILIFLVISCSDSPAERKDGFSETAKNPEDSLYQVVMDQHDVAMSKMGRITRYRKQIVHTLDSLKKIKSPAKAAKESKLKELDEELKQAADHMNAWMEQFSIDSAQNDPERRIQYLGSENQKVTKVKEEVLAATAKADSLLKQ